MGLVLEDEGMRCGQVWPSSVHSRKGPQNKMIPSGAIGLTFRIFFWPFYELGKLYRNAVDQIKLQGGEKSFLSLKFL